MLTMEVLKGKKVKVSQLKRVVGTAMEVLK